MIEFKSVDRSHLCTISYMDIIDRMYKDSPKELIEQDYPHHSLGSIGIKQQIQEVSDQLYHCIHLGLSVVFHYDKI